MSDHPPLTPASEILLRRLGPTDALRQELADIEAAAVDRALEPLVERTARLLRDGDDSPWELATEASRAFYRDDARRMLGLLLDEGGESR